MCDPYNKQQQRSHRQTGKAGDRTRDTCYWLLTFPGFLCVGSLFCGAMSSLARLHLAVCAYGALGWSVVGLCECGQASVYPQQLIKKCNQKCNQRHNVEHVVLTIELRLTLHLNKTCIDMSCHIT